MLVAHPHNYVRNRKLLHTTPVKTRQMRQEHLKELPFPIPRKKQERLHFAHFPTPSQDSETDWKRNLVRVQRAYLPRKLKRHMIAFYWSKTDNATIAARLSTTDILRRASASLIATQQQRKCYACADDWYLPSRSHHRVPQASWIFLLVEHLRPDPCLSLVKR